MLQRRDKGLNLFKLGLIFLSILTLSGCLHKAPPADIENVCHIFYQYPKWYGAAKDVEKRWKIPIAVQMAIIHQESKFDAIARPRYPRLIWFIPGKRRSSAYGYAQALHGTWKEYKQSNGWLLSSRNDFSDGVDFIGWYANQAALRAKIPRSDAYSLYLAYHEGIGGYQRQSYLKKPWLMQVAHKVKSKAQLYEAQFKGCRKALPRSAFLF